MGSKKTSEVFSLKKRLSHENRCSVSACGSATSCNERKGDKVHRDTLNTVTLFTIMVLYIYLVLCGPLERRDQLCLPFLFLCLALSPVVILSILTQGVSCKP